MEADLGFGVAPIIQFFSCMFLFYLITDSTIRNYMTNLRVNGEAPPLPDS